MNRGASGPRIARPLSFWAALLLCGAAGAAPWEEPEWLRLGHYRPSGRGWKSDAHGEGFFLAREGRVDPRAEYEALRAAISAAGEAGDGHARCRFPARSAWLARKEGLSLPELRCPRYEDWRALLDLGSASLVFASSYLNNPSSMFGHTFLRLERRRVADRLLDNTLNYAAETGADGGMLFAVKGLLGLYPGKYTVMPYHMKVAEYGAIEHRDLWEYRLALAPEEVEALAAHAWEMGQATFPYLFLSKNCSYQLLPALEAAAPRLSLLRGSPLIVAPIETVRAARETPGLVSAAAYRPSHATIMRQRRALLSSQERSAAEAYAFGDAAEGDRRLASVREGRRGLVLDSAQDYVLYKKGFSPDVPAEVRELEHALLTRRARLSEPVIPAPQPAWAAPPEEGHRRRRLALGGGISEGNSFVELGWRAGYHDLLDRPRGFTPGAGVEGLSARLRYDVARRRPYVRDLRVAEVLSVSPFDPWMNKPSWSAGFGLDTAFEKRRPAPDALLSEVHAGSGLSAEPADEAVVFLLAQGEAAAGAALRRGYRLGGALRGGLALSLSPRWRALLDGALTAQAWGDRTPAHRLRAGLNWAPARDWALRGEGLLRGHYREAGVHVHYHY